MNKNSGNFTTSMYHISKYIFANLYHTSIDSINGNPYGFLIKSRGYWKKSAAKIGYFALRKREEKFNG